MFRINHSLTSSILKEPPMSLLNLFNQVVSSAERPAEASGTNSNDTVFSKIILANDKRITILSADGTKVINDNEGFLDELAYHMDGPLRLNSNEYVKNYKSLTNSLTYSGNPTAITYQDARSKVTSVKMGKPGVPKVSKVFPFFISKSCSDPRTMVFSIKDMCYITRNVRNLGGPPAKEIGEVLTTIISDFKRFTSIVNGLMNPTCGQKVKIANNYDEFPFSRVIASNDWMIVATARLFLSDSIIKSYDVEQIEQILIELLRFVQVSGEGKQFENFEVEVSIMRLSNVSQEYHIHAGKDYNMNLDERPKLEFSVENTLRDIVCHGYSASNAHPFDLCRGVVMVPFIQNFKLVTTSGEEEENDFNRNIGQPPPYSQQ